ncbi:hypothetical protein F4825DRAFT_425472 [Nemania diffusa]|nr:hypothetical protein F4825DRAFT_425472 [Nemania diffusa]
MAEDRLFACPFIFKDRRNHSRCLKYELKRIKDVKQHLLRAHLRPRYCPRCYATFNNDEERDEHVRVCNVEDHPPVNIDGISDNQQMILHKRSNSKHTVEEKWYFLWETIFPNVDRPTGIYIDEVYSYEMFLLQRFMATEGVTIFCNYLNGHAGIYCAPPANETDVVRFQESVGRAVLERVFQGFTRGVITDRPAAALDPSSDSCGNIRNDVISTKQLELDGIPETRGHRQLNELLRRRHRSRGE